MSLVNCTTILLFLFIYNTATIIDSIGNIEMLKACFSLNNNFEEKNNSFIEIWESLSQTLKSSEENYRYSVSSNHAEYFRSKSSIRGF